MAKSPILLQKIGINVKNLRLKKNLTQEQLAELCGNMDRCLISRLERFDCNDIRVGTVIKLSEALGVNIAELFK